MGLLSAAQHDALRRTAGQLARAGATITIEAPGVELLEVGSRPERARVRFQEPAAVEALRTGDHLALAEAYLDGRIDVEGAMEEVMKVTDAFDLEPSRLAKLHYALSFALDRRRFNRETVAFHYDRPPEFFLPWLDRWRSYSHGFYTSPDDALTEAQERKLQYALDALGLEPGKRVLDMGGGWGCFLEYAGRQGIRVESLTISEEQHRYCEALIREADLPCSVELVDFDDYRPKGRFDAAVFMGTFEHVPDYGRAAAFLAEHLEPGGRVYADFCAQRKSYLLGAFMRKHVWPGSARYVDVTALVRELVHAGFNVYELADDTLSYAYTVRDWAHGFERARGELTRRWGESQVRAFLLFLWGSYRFLTTNRSQAYHLVAGRGPAPLGTSR